MEPDDIRDFRKAAKILRGYQRIGPVEIKTVLDQVFGSRPRPPDAVWQVCRWLLSWPDRPIDPPAPPPTPAHWQE